MRSTKVIEVETVVKVLDEEKLKEAEEKINREKAQIVQQIEAERRKIENAINVDEEEKKRFFKFLNFFIFYFKDYFMKMNSVKSVLVTTTMNKKI